MTVNPDNYPDRDYPNETPSALNDWGGVHSNSSIVNHAFFLSVVGGQHVNAFTETQVRALGADVVQDIYFDAYKRFNYTTNFEEAAYALTGSAESLFGMGEAAGIMQAWHAISVIENMWGNQGDDWQRTYMGWTYFDTSTNWALLSQYANSWAYWSNYDSDSGNVWLHLQQEQKYIHTNAEVFPWYYDNSDSSWKVAVLGSPL